MSERITTAHIDVEAYKHNLSTIRSQLETQTKLMVVVKANAYGHGLVPLARAAAEAGVEYLGVVSVGEAQKLRREGVTTPCLILNYLDPESTPEAVEAGADITIMDAVSIDTIQAAAESQGKTVRIHLKVDTGMHRAGCEPSEVVELARRIKSCPNLQFEGVFTHFAEADSPDLAFSRQQLSVFNGCLEALANIDLIPPLVHAANSAALLTLPESHFTMVRPGIVTYGLNPFSPEHPSHETVQETFQPVLSLSSKVAHVRTVAEGEGVGYGRSWKAARHSRLALVPVGYGDGYRRAPQNAQYVLIHGQKAPVVGRVSMDQTVVDVTDISEVLVGDDVVLLGTQQTTSISADDIAAWYGTINYEVVTALSDRVTRIYSGK